MNATPRPRIDITYDENLLRHLLVSKNTDDQVRLRTVLHAVNNYNAMREALEVCLSVGTHGEVPQWVSETISKHVKRSLA